MGKLDAILDQMSRARSGLLSTADSVAASHWRASPGPDCWSAAEVVAHLTMVDTKIRSVAERLIQQAPQAVPFWKKAHVPLRFVEWRLVRRKSPLSLDGSLLADKEVMLGRMRDARAQTLAFLSQEGERDLSAYRWPHPFLGSLSICDWFRFLAYHEMRHTKQLQEIVD